MTAVLNTIKIQLPNEILNMIFSYVQSNTNTLVKEAISKYYYSAYCYLRNGWSLHSITYHNKKIGARKTFYYSKERVSRDIKNMILEHGSEIWNFLQNDYSNKTYKNMVLVSRNILTEYIKTDNKRRKRSGTKKAFIKSQKDYNKRKQLKLKLKKR